MSDDPTITPDPLAPDAPGIEPGVDPAPLPAEPAPDEDAPKDGAPYYCPGCGRAYGYQTECRGATLEAPHPPIEVVSTDELRGEDTSKHTAAPDTGI